ncbi:hypothetical protein AAFF_G00420790 [Aldrovandia affinis]|uniref:Leucine-rich repeat-containing protein 49 n=1 Tax=Aldrovandia affinis TaxID=143900 RepID=A0AAD7S9L1_9TELE|nr:hypothetical protein AAFF_G00420790 [Aldrovandia affinis]
MRPHKPQNSNKGRLLTPTMNIKLPLAATRNSIAPERQVQRRLDLRLSKELSKETATDTLKMNPPKQESRSGLHNGGRPPPTSVQGFASECAGLERIVLPLPAAAPCGLTGYGRPQAHRIRSRRVTHSSGTTYTHSNPSLMQTAGDTGYLLENAALSYPLAFRSPEDCTANPDRLDMDRRGLEECPLLEGEERLRLLNFQHNLISRIDNLSHLRRLVFLDLYNNRIAEMSGLSTLTLLRVLILGKNRIKRIWNLDTLTKLDVLDLHGNQIVQVENISHLSELRLLNLAWNRISRVDNLQGLDSLTELNLRHNIISCVTEVDRLPSLKRLFLSCNCITSFDELTCLRESCSLSELTLDGNPVAQESWYRQATLRHAFQLRQLDMKRITEEERRMACVLARKDDEKKRESHKQAIHKEKRRQAIRNAAQQWEGLRTCLELPPPQNGAKDEVSPENTPAQPDGHQQPISPDELRRVSPVGAPERPAGGSEGRIRSSSRPNSPRSSEAGGASVQSLSLSDSHLAELDGDTLRLFGLGALEALERGWGVQTAGAVTFPNLSHLIFMETNISRLPQLAALAVVRRLDQLTIHPEGNPVVGLALWRSFAIFRLNHFNLQKINGQEVTMSDVVTAEKRFGTLGYIAATETPHCRLLLLLEESRKRQLQFILEGRGRRAGLSPDELRENGKLLGEGLSRALFNYPSRDTSTESPEEGAVEPSERAAETHRYLKGLVQRASDTNVKGEMLHKLWPSMFAEMVRDCVLEMRDRPAYRKACLKRREQATMANDTPPSADHRAHPPRHTLRLPPTTAPTHHATHSAFRRPPSRSSSRSRLPATHWPQPNGSPVFPLLRRSAFTQGTWLQVLTKDCP